MEHPIKQQGSTLQPGWIADLMKDTLQLPSEECMAVFNPYWFHETAKTTLSSKEYTVLKLRYACNFSLNETGKQLGISHESVRQVQFKAMEKLREPKVRDRYECRSKFEYDALEKKLRDSEQEKQRFRSLLITYPGRDTQGSSAGYPSTNALCLQPCIVKALEKNGIKTTKDLLTLSRQDLMELPSIGEKRAAMIEAKLNEFGLSLTPNASLRQLALLPRTEHALLRANINTIGKACKLSDKELKKIRGLGKKSRMDLINAVKKLGCAKPDQQEGIE